MTRQRAALAAAQTSLAGIDPVLDELVATHGPCRLTSPPAASARYASLAESIAYQQLHGAAAASIWGRVREACGGAVDPEAILALGEGPLRASGLSGAKVRSLLDLSDRVAAGELVLERIGRLDDDGVITALTTVWGIGVWTAHMFLIFTLGRLDVWPTGDYGVRAGYGRAWGLPDAPTEVELAPLGDRFDGARSLVAWYCWRAADTKGGRSE